MRKLFYIFLILPFISFDVFSSNFFEDISFLPEENEAIFSVLQNEFMIESNKYTFRAVKPGDEKGIKDILRKSHTIVDFCESKNTYKDVIQWTEDCYRCKPHSHEKTFSIMESCLTCSVIRDTTFVLESDSKILFVVFFKAYFPTLENFLSNYEGTIRFFKRYPFPSEKEPEKNKDLEKFRAQLNEEQEQDFSSLCQAYYSSGESDPYFVRDGDWERLRLFVKQSLEALENQNEKSVTEIQNIKLGENNRIRDYNLQLMCERGLSESDIKGSIKKYYDFIQSAADKIWVRPDYYIHPDAVGRGLGTSLLTHVRDTLFQNPHIGALMTTCATLNTPSYNLLKKLGGEEIHHDYIDRNDKTKGHPDGGFEERISTMFIENTYRKKDD